MTDNNKHVTDCPIESAKRPLLTQLRAYASGKAQRENHATYSTFVQHNRQAALVIGLSLAVAASSRLPAWCQLDAFELPPGIENTKIPKQLRRGMIPKKGVNPEDVRRIETLRTNIENCYKNSTYTEAEPSYREYVALLERVGADDAKLGKALQNYAQLLRKLNKTSEAESIEIKANAVLTRSAAASLTYGLKEYRLGMSLDEFVRLDPPGGDSKKVKAICSCDPGQIVELVTPEDKNAKVVQCGIWNVDPSGGVTVPHAISVASVECEPDFRFVENDGAYRLYEISMVFYNSKFETIKQALVQKYGDPTGQEVEKMRTDMGNNYPLTNLIWDNGVSKIRLSNADGTNTGRAKLRYIHRQLFLAYAKRVNDAKDSPGRQAATDL